MNRNAKDGGEEFNSTYFILCLVQSTLNNFSKNVFILAKLNIARQRQKIKRSKIFFEIKQFLDAKKMKMELSINQSLMIKIHSSVTMALLKKSQMTIQHVMMIRL